MCCRRRRRWWRDLSIFARALSQHVMRSNYKELLYRRPGRRHRVLLRELVRLSDTSNRHVWKHHEEYEVNCFRIRCMYSDTSDSELGTITDTPRELELAL
jgi:hypothetical protein